MKSSKIQPLWKLGLWGVTTTKWWQYSGVDSSGVYIPPKCMKIPVRKREPKIEGNTKENAMSQSRVVVRMLKRNALRILRKLWRKFENCERNAQQLRKNVLNRKFNLDDTCWGGQPVVLEDLGNEVEKTGYVCIKIIMENLQGVCSLEIIYKRRKIIENKNTDTWMKIT